MAALINERQDDRQLINVVPENTAQNDRDAEEIRLLSAASFGFALTFLSIFNSYMVHQFPNENMKESQSVCSQTENSYRTTTRSTLRILYVGLGATGFMLLLGTALLSYKFSLLFRRGKPRAHSQRHCILCCFYIVAFLGVASSLSSHAIGIYLVHCDHDNLYLAFVAPAAGIFFLMIALYMAVEAYFKE